MKVSTNMLREKAQSVEVGLQEHGVFCKVKPYFAYGMYEYEIKWGIEEGLLESQYMTGFGTRRECYEALEKAFYKILYYSERAKTGKDV